MVAMNAPGPILITGATGMLGTALGELCAEHGLTRLLLAEADLDITDTAAVDAAMEEFAAEGGRLVVNPAAYTDVERAEAEEDRAFAVNERGAANVAAAAARRGLELIHVSTDFVFDGAKARPYTEADEPRPLNAYGRSKLAGERAVFAAHPHALVVRTAWTFGPGGPNFPTKIAALARERPELEVVADEFGSPTAAADLAEGLLELSRTGAQGLFHLAGAGSCSRYELAQEVLATLGLAARVVPVGRDTFPTKAVRPAYSVLDCWKARRLGVVMPPWRDSLRAYVRRYLGEAAA
jgi:dTDP-4-dehydrorhamnose reductase